MLSNPEVTTNDRTGERPKQVFIRFSLKSLMKINVIRKFPQLLILALLTFGAVCQIWAQADKYKPGDKIEYLESPIKNLWEEGVFMYATPDGKQPVIRKKPNEFYKDGAQTAFDWDRIRPLNPNAKPMPTPAPAATAKPAQTLPPTVPAPTPASATAKPEPPTPVETINLKGPLLSQEDVLNFLKTRLGNEPFSHPQRQEIKKELAELIKSRGVNFRYQNLSEFSNQLGKYGASSEVIFPLQANYGPPTKQAWLMGKWSLSKVGATVDYKGNDGYIYRQTEIGVKDVGFIQISADGKYTWNIDVPKGIAQGTWRPAKKDEMPYQGGDAIVLLKAKGGVDWIVHQDRVTELKGDWVNVTQLDARQIREGGFRTAPAGK